MLKFEDILRFEASGNYTDIFLVDGKKITSSKQIGVFEEMLSPNLFFRVHQSHIINLSKIKKYVGGGSPRVIFNEGTAVVVAIRRKEAFLEKVKSSK